MTSHFCESQFFLTTRYVYSIFILLIRFCETFATMTPISKINFLSHMSLIGVCFLIWNREKLENLLTALVHGISDAEIIRIDRFITKVHILHGLQAVSVAAVYLIPLVNSNMITVISRFSEPSGERQNWFTIPNVH